MENCIFCKIAKRLVPKEFTLETDQVMVFPDIAPVAPIHLLIVSKKHIADFTKIKKDLKIWKSLVSVLLELIKKQKLTLAGYRIVINGGGAQLINHLHIHLMGGIKKERKL